MNSIGLYLLDIEGTVAPLTLTTELLFPYARAHLAEFLSAHAGDPAVKADLALLAEENRAESEPGAPRIPETQILRLGRRPPQRRRPVAGDPGRGGLAQDDKLVYIFWLMDRDRKSTALKSLQGKIWKAGFESGELKGTLFDDVPPALERWSKHAKVAIYSSGSVEAQKLLFSHTTAGDLTRLISAYFDTRTGPKFESASYAAIAAEMEVTPAEVLFFSDAVRELDAAREAGCGTRLVVRPGNGLVEDARSHAVIETL